MSQTIIGFDIGIKNFAYCIIKKENTAVNIIALENIDLQCRKYETQKIIDAIIDLLDDIFYNQLEKLNSNKIHVIIESQMTSIMKCIQTVVNTFFKMQKKYQNINIETKYVSAKHKLNLIDKYKDKYEGHSNILNTAYRQNKIDSVHFAKWLIQNESKYYNEIIIQKFETTKKCDDLADALLMSIYFTESL